MGNPIQHYALSEDDLLVDAREVRKEDHHSFRCPYCKQEMVVRQGNHNVWHFAHKADNIEKCSYNNYLHTIAKYKIQEWFQQSPHIYIKYNATHKCDKCGGCPWNCDLKETEQQESFDLKSRFTKCQIEQEFTNSKGRFVADVLCCNPKELNHPLFLEVFVTHPCEPEKVNSGIRIIEFEIHSEEDIEHIVSGDSIIESESIRFYGIRPKPITDSSFRILLQKFTIYKSHKLYLDKEHTTCRNDLHRKGIFELTTSYEDEMPSFLSSGGIWNAGIAKAIQCGVDIKDCMFCKSYRYNNAYERHICILYKKRNALIFSERSEASSCPYYQLDEQFLSSQIEAYEEEAAKRHIDVWKFTPQSPDDGQGSLFPSEP